MNIDLAWAHKSFPADRNVYLSDRPGAAGGGGGGGGGGTESGAIVVRAALQTFTTTASFVSFDTEIQDTESYWSAVNPTRITIPTAGWYTLIGTVTQSVDPDDYQTLSWSKNGAAYSLTQHGSRTGGSTSIATASQVIDTDYYEAGDYLELRVANRTGNSTAYAKCSVIRISATAGGGGGGGALEYVGGTTLSAANQIIDVTGLNLTADGTYYVEYELKGNSVGTWGFEIDCNGDTTAANYSTQSHGVNGSSYGGARNANSVIQPSVLGTADAYSGQINIRRNLVGQTRMWMESHGLTNSYISLNQVTWLPTTNLTSLQLKSTNANGFAIGSYMKVWKISATTGGGGGGSIFPATTVPLAADFTWVNQGTSSVADKTARMVMTVPNVAGTNLRCLVKTAPGTPYTVTAAFAVAAIGSASASQVIGLLLRNSGSGLIRAFYLVVDAGANYFTVNNWTNATSFASGAFASNTAHPGAYVWMRITDDGTNRKFLISGNGRDWTEIYTDARTAFVTADQVGIIGYNNIAGTLKVPVVHFRTDTSVLGDDA
jgi:hypothetical protein